MGSVKGTMEGEVVLNKARFAYEQRKLDYNRSSTVPVIAVEGHWHVGKSDREYSTSYFFEAQPVRVEFILDAGFVSPLIDECYRCTGLYEVHDVKLEDIEFGFAYHHNYRDAQTFEVTIRGTGHHSKVMWDASAFVVKRHTSDALCAMLRDIFVHHLNMDIGKYPRE